MTSWVRAAVLRFGVDAGLIAVSAADAAVSALSSERGSHGIAFAILALVALLFRTRAPYVVFALTIPALVTDSGAIASLVALFSVAELRPQRGRLILCALTTFVCHATPWEQLYDGVGKAWDVLYALLFTLAPISLGMLVRARSELSRRLEEVERVRQHEQELLVEQALARERADLAREMHDVISHQVSLIAVQAGALQVSTLDRATVEKAQTIRTLCVHTLDELRQMVGVLRAAGSPLVELAPRPGIDDLPVLLAASGVPTTITNRCGAPLTPSASVQHVIYRAVQEGLTNVAKHAPGARAELELNIEHGQALLTLTNTRPTRLPDALPSARQGLVGLRERAELLGGSLRSGRLCDGGFELSITLPTHE